MEALGWSMDMLEALVRWNPLLMDAMLQGRPPPPLPAGLSLGLRFWVSERGALAAKVLV